MAKTEEKTIEVLEEGQPPEAQSEEQIRARLAQVMEEQEALRAMLPPAPAPPGVPPGTILNKGTPGETKVAWDWGHLRERQAAGVWEFREVTFTPIFTGPIIWNGLRVDLTAGDEITTFGIFKGEYEKVRRARGVNDNYFGPLRPEEKQAFAGFRSRPHRMDFGGLDPRPGEGTTPGTQS